MLNLRSCEARDGGRIPPTVRRITPVARLQNRSWAIALAGLAIAGCVWPVASFACGPFFPNSMLDRGDAAVLASPVADFQRELERLLPAAAAFHAVITTNPYPDETLAAELSDLRAALKKAHTPMKEKAAILADYELQRERLHRLQAAQSNAAAPPDAPATELDPTAPAAGTNAPPPAPVVPENLPAEFADYFRGAIAFRLGRTNEARAEWAALLERPEAERHFRSTWAAYMQGRLCGDAQPSNAIAYYQQVRDLARRGFADSLGLAAASLGWEARANLKQKRFAPAIERYLDQLAAGDSGAVISLRVTASAALEAGGSALRGLAKNPRARGVITAALISDRRNYDEMHDFGDHTPADGNGDSSAKASPAEQWLAAVEAAGVKDVESAERLALAAYQIGRWDLAQRWVTRSQATPTAQWLQAKLLLRAGKCVEAGALLAKVARLFPVEPPDTNRPPSLALKDNLIVAGNSYTASRIDGPSEVLAELGVFHLARRQYTEALDALLRSGFWMDAAYVAERVLTTDELRAYVDSQWPAPPPETNSPASDVASPGPESPSAETGAPSFEVGKQIRYLLARRLTRLSRGAEARPYFPKEYLPDFDALLADLRAGWEESQPAADRARALIEAAKLARHRGLELLGTEVEPDWHVHGGDYEEGVSIASRPTSGPPGGLFASEDELTRAVEHAADPEQRFHYRYQAAFLAWEAAKLLPNNSDETARVLCTAGSWLKARDPDTADLFYKALVRRCRKTAIGELADKMRWFPVLDADGNVVPWKPEPPTEADLPSPVVESGAEPLATTEPSAGYWYVLHRGNSLADVVQAVRTAHQVEVNVKELLDANPGVNPGRLKVGQKIFVPAQGAPAVMAPGLESEPAPAPADGSGPPIEPPSR